MGRELRQRKSRPTYTVDPFALVPGLLSDGGEPPGDGRSGPVSSDGASDDDEFRPAAPNEQAADSASDESMSAVDEDEEDNAPAEPDDDDVLDDAARKKRPLKRNGGRFPVANPLNYSTGFDRSVSIQIQEDVRFVSESESLNVLEPFDPAQIEVLPEHRAARTRLISLIVQHLREVLAAQCTGDPLSPAQQADKNQTPHAPDAHGDVEMQEAPPLAEQNLPPPASEPSLGPPSNELEGQPKKAHRRSSKSQRAQQVSAEEQPAPSPRIVKKRGRQSKSSAAAANTVVDEPPSPVAAPTLQDQQPPSSKCTPSKRRGRPSKAELAARAAAAAAGQAPPPTPSRKRRQRNSVSRTKSGDGLVLTIEKRDGKFICPIAGCNQPSLSRSAIINHCRNNVHSITPLLRVLFPRAPGEERSRLTGTLPDDHPLCAIREDILELLLHIPLPMYPLEVRIADTLMLQGISTKYDFPFVFDAPHFDVYAYPQLKSVFSLQPQFAHVRYLVLASVQHTLRKYQVAAEAQQSAAAAKVAAPQLASLSGTPISRPEVLALEARSAKKKSTGASKRATTLEDAEDGAQNGGLMLTHISGPVLAEALPDNDPARPEDLEALLSVLPSDPSIFYDVVDTDEAMAQLEHISPNASCTVSVNGGEPVTLPRFGSTSFDTLRPSCILNASGSIWSLDWMGNRLCVAGYLTNDEHHEIGARTPGPGVIQIWHFNFDTCKASLETCIMHSWGPVFDLKWWPASKFTGPTLLLGACFGDGTFRILPVFESRSPDPEFVAVKAPLFEHSFDNTTYFKMAWGGLEYVAVGCANGYISLFHVPSLVRRTLAEPIAHFPAHDSYVRDLAFESGADPLRPRQLVSAGADGRLLAWDVRDLFVPIPIFRARAFLMCCDWAKFQDSVLLVDSDHTMRVVRTKAIDASSPSIPTHQFHTHTATVWSVKTSAYHPFVCTVSTDGMPKITNMNRIRHRGVKPIAMPLYNLRYNRDSRTNIYNDDLPFETPAKKVVQLVWYYEPEVALQTASWANTREHCGWIATAGTNGLVRIENTFKNNSSS